VENFVCVCVPRECELSYEFLEIDAFSVEVKSQPTNSQYLGLECTQS